MAGYESACIQVNVCDEAGIISSSQWFVSQEVASHMKALISKHLGAQPLEAMIDGMSIRDECNTIANNSVIIAPGSD